MNPFLIAPVYIFEHLVAYYYFNKKFKRKQKGGIIFLAFALSFIVQLSIQYLEMFWLNITVFIISNFIILISCYNTKIKSAIYSCIMLSILNIATEAIAIFTRFYITQEATLSPVPYDMLTFMLDVLPSKLLYLISVFIISKISVFEKRAVKNYSSSLILMPILSIVTFVTIVDFAFKQAVKKPNLIIWLFIVLLVMNIIVFFVHEKSISVLTENAELEIEHQKDKINKEYYDELEKQYDAMNILVHDIKKHLIAIKELSLQENSTLIADYVDSVYESNEVESMHQFSKSKLVNVIINRYIQLCRNEEINFYCDIRNVDFSFLKDSELTSILDNLLENAYEAAKKTKEKKINLYIDIKNEFYMVINLKNSSAGNPLETSAELKTTKENKIAHGFGLKSINKIVNKHNGIIKQSYDSNLKEFKTVVLIKTVDFDNISDINSLPPPDFRTDFRIRRKKGCQK